MENSTTTINWCDVNGRQAWVEISADIAADLHTKGIIRHEELVGLYVHENDVDRFFDAFLALPELGKPS